MDSPAGLVALAILVVWLAYFVPSRLRHRQQISTARTEDRFSAQLRVVAVSGGDSLERVPGADCAPGGQRTERLLTPPNGISAGGRRPRGVQDVERSGISAARREQVSRRQAAARRRALVTAIVATLTVVTVVLAAVTPLAMLVALVPGLLLASVLVLGRRAVVADARADAELRHRERIAARATESARVSARVSGSRLVGRPAPVVKPRVTGRAVPVSHAATEVLGSAASLAAASRATGSRGSSVAAASTTGTHATQQPAAIRPASRRPAARADEARSAAVAKGGAAASGAAATGWVDTSVPRPTYAMKPAAPRWEPAPLSAEIERVGRRLGKWDEEDGRVSDALVEELDVALTPVDGETDNAVDAGGAEAQRAAGGLGGGLDGILERRRAAGE